jgi:hypothetical protein
VIAKQYLSKLSDSEDSWFVCNQHEKCGKQGKESVNQRLRHHIELIKEKAMVLA